MAPRKCILALAGLGAILACSDGTSVSDLPPARFALESSGSETIHLEGTAFVMPLQVGAYGRLDPSSGRFRYDDVVPLVLTGSSPWDLSGPMLSIGFIGELRPGRHVPVSDASAGDPAPRFYAELIVPDADGWRRHYQIDQGEITILDVEPRLRGTLSLRGSTMVRLPADPTVGVSAQATEGPIAVSGLIGGGGAN